MPTVRRAEQRQSGLPTPSASPPRERRPPIHRHVFSSFTAAPRSPITHLASSPPPHRRPNSSVQTPIIQALNDAFRISTPSYSPPSSISDSTWRTLRLSHVRNGREGDDYEEILVIPSMGDRSIESEVHALLDAHTTRDYEQEDEDDPNTGSTHADYAYRAPRTRPDTGSTRQEEDMEVDELGSDCASSRGPSRSGSPTPAQGRHPPGLGDSGGRRSRTRTEKSLAPEIVYTEDLDLAGTCFDPTGGHIYVASTESVVEWSIRDADKRWWFDQSWR